MEVDKVQSLHASLPGRLDRARRVFGRPLPLSEKILVAHAADFDHQMKKPDGRVERIEAVHTMTREQIAWFRGGKAGLADAKLAPGDTPGVAPDDTRAKP